MQKNSFEIHRRSFMKSYFHWDYCKSLYPVSYKAFRATFVLFYLTMTILRLCYATVTLYNPYLLFLLCVYLLLSHEVANTKQPNILFDFTCNRSESLLHNHYIKELFYKYTKKILFKQIKQNVFC